MSWVLILTSSYCQRPPAVIGGYRTRDDAEGAGIAATEVSTNTEDPIPESHRHIYRSS